MAEERKDLSRRVETDARFEHFQNLMRYIVEHARSAIAVHDKDLKYVFVSQSYRDEYKVKEKDIIGKHHYEVFPDLPQKWRDVHQRALAGETVSAEDDPYPREDGSVDWTRWECRPWYEADGTIGGIIIYTEVINEQIHVTQKLAEDEHYLRTILQTTADGFWVVDTGGKIVDVNEAYCRMSGYAREELLKMSIADLDADDTPADVKARIRRIIESGSVLFERRHRRKDGTVLDVEMSVTYLNARGGQFICFCRDIGDRKTIQAALKESEEKYRRLAENSADVVWTMDLNLRTTYVSPSVERLLGETVDEHLNKSIAERLTPDSLERVYAIFKEELQNEQDPNIDKNRTRCVEVEHYKTDGSIIWAAMNVSFMRDEEGDIVGIQGVTRDITERIRAEEQLQKSHDLLSNLARMVPGVIYQYALHPDGRSAFPYASPGMNEIYEVAPEELREDATAVFGRLHPEDRDRVADAIFESARTLEMFQCEFRAILPQQGLRWRWSQAKPQRMRDGGALWHGIILDITERKQAEEERARLQDQLQQAQRMESVGRLAGGVAHDYNNMLSVIMGYAELALMMLGRLGYQVLAAGTPNQAMELAKEHAGDIDLLITDVVMPHMNGRELSGQIHTLYPGLKTLFMSGYTANVIAHRGVLEEGTNFIQKPFSVNDLGIKIRTVLGQK